LFEANEPYSASVRRYKRATYTFWHWFSQYYEEFGQNFDHETALIELDNKIMDLGDFAWEIGPVTKERIN
jgi:hypothetical protein